MHFAEIFIVSSGPFDYSKQALFSGLKYIHEMYHNVLCTLQRFLLFLVGHLTIQNKPCLVV